MMMVACSRKGAQVWFVGRTFSAALEVMRTMRECPEFMALVDHAFLQFPPRFRMKSGSTINFVSGDSPNNLRGGGLALACLDEAAYQKPEIIAALTPKLLDSGGTLIYGSTYNGRNFYYDAIEKAKKAANPNVKVWTYKTEEGMAFRGPAGKKRLADYKDTIDPMTWAQEMDCQPLAVQNCAFNYLDRIIGGVPKAAIKGQKYICSVDLGRVIDQEACIVLEVATGNIVHSHYFVKGQEHTIMANEIRQISDRYGASVVVDSTGGANPASGDSVVHFYRKAIPNLREIFWTHATKLTMINNLALEIEQALIHVPLDYPEIHAQLREYRYRTSEVTGSHPIFFGKKDDFVAALAMACYARKNNWVRDNSLLPLSYI